MQGRRLFHETTFFFGGAGFEPGTSLDAAQMPDTPAALCVSWNGSGAVPVTTEPEEDSSPTVWLPIIVVGFAFLMNAVARGVPETFAVYLLPLTETFGWERAQLTGGYAVYMLTTGVSGPIAGHLMDRFGPRVVYGLGLFSMGSGYLIASYYLDQIWQFYLCIGLMAGIGTACVGMIQGSVLASRWFRERLSLALGIIYAGAGTGTLIMAPVSQTLIDAWGWRAAYEALGLGILGLLVLLAVLPLGRMAAGNPAMRKDVTPAGDEAPGWTLSAAMKTLTFWGCFNVFCFTSMMVFSVVPQLVAFWVEIGIDPLLAAYGFGAMGFLSIGGVATIGLLVARLGRRMTATISYVMSLTGIIALVGMVHVGVAPLFVGFVLVFGVTQGVRGPIIGAVTARIFGGPGLGTVYGAITIGMGIGAGIGALVSGILHDLTGGYVATFIFAFCAGLIGVAQFWLIPALRRD